MAYSTASKAGMVNNPAREAQRKYQRDWRRANPQKVREYNERYWEKKAAETGRVNDG